MSLAFEQPAAIPTFPAPSSTAPGDARILQSDVEAIEAARAFAERIRPGAIERDQRHRLPHEELADLARTGLLALRVPKDFGGPGASHKTVAEVIRLISAGDSAIGQIPQNHTQFVHALGEFGTQEQKRFFFGELLRGVRFGNALSERGTKHPLDFATTIAPDSAGGYRLNGRKYYSTGALTAQWIPVFAAAVGVEGVAERKATLLYVPRDAEGVDVQQDWTAFGQRSTISGTTTFDNVRVPAEHVVQGFWDLDRPTTTGPFGQLIHAAVDVGLAGGALADGVAFARHHGRAHWESGLDRLTDEPAVISRFGQLRVRLDAAEALLSHAGEVLDMAERERTNDAVTKARLAVAAAKAFGGETALEIATVLFDAGGASASDARHGLDRHWRNARTHTLHDPNRWKYIHIGNYLLNDVVPATDNLVI